MHLFCMNTVESFDLIIFDCDGVLVDSERITAEVFGNVLFEECGLSMTIPDLLRTFLGKSSKESLEIIEGLTGRKPPSTLEARYQGEIISALKQSVTAVCGIKQALAEITIPYCVASDGSHEKMRTTLNKAGLLKLFEGKLYSASDVQRRKPFPDIYLHAAHEMGRVAPHRCLVIEDSPVGVKGGVAAGMIVFGYAEFIKDDWLAEAGAHHVFKEMSALPGEITAYLRN